MTIHVVGGLYKELCVRPWWDQLYGSAGRAAAAIATMGNEVYLHTYANSAVVEDFRRYAAQLPSTLTLEAVPCDTTLLFRYLHDSSHPDIYGVPDVPLDPIYLEAEQIIRFGMLEGSAIVNAEWAVYDPQNAGSAELFGQNGSRAKHLALVLNLYEARVMSSSPTASAEECAHKLAALESAEVIVIKMGPAGALIWSQGTVHTVPAYKTENVWKIGSGDTFVAHFARAWMNDGVSAHEAAAQASLATAYYCDKKILPCHEYLSGFNPDAIRVEQDFLDGKRPRVYLAGPFFDTAQVWLIEEARKNLQEMGFDVFSPFHDIGMGSAADVVKLDILGIETSDIIFAIADGLDAGTIYEVGYARALRKPVVILCERESEESMKMAEGTDCIIRRSYTSSLYAALWAAVSQ